VCQCQPNNENQHPASAQVVLQPESETGPEILRNIKPHHPAREGVPDNSAPGSAGGNCVAECVRAAAQAAATRPEGFVVAAFAAT
jgi:hypothetical protein